MSVSYDLFDKAFLAKISEFEILTLDESTRQDLVDGYMKRAIANFKRIANTTLLARQMIISGISMWTLTKKISTSW